MPMTPAVRFSLGLCVDISADDTAIITCWIWREAFNRAVRNYWLRQGEPGTWQEKLGWLCDSVFAALSRRHAIGLEIVRRQGMTGPAHQRTGSPVGAAMFIMMGGLIAGDGSQARVA